MSAEGRAKYMPEPVNRGGATLTPMPAPESTELVALDIFARAEVGRTFEIVGTIFTLCGLVNAWRRSTNRIRNAVDVIVEDQDSRPAVVARADALRASNPANARVATRSRVGSDRSSEIAIITSVTIVTP